MPINKYFLHKKIYKIVSFSVTPWEDFFFLFNENGQADKGDYIFWDEIFGERLRSNIIITNIAHWEKWFDHYMSSQMFD